MSINAPNQKNIFLYLWILSTFLSTRDCAMNTNLKSNIKNHSLFSYLFHLSHNHPYFIWYTFTFIPIIRPLKHFTLILQIRKFGYLLREWSRGQTLVNNKTININSSKTKVIHPPPHPPLRPGGTPYESLMSKLTTPIVWQRCFLEY